MKTPSKEAKKISKVTVRLSKEYITLLEKYARQNHRSITNTVEYAIRTFIKMETLELQVLMRKENQ